MEDLSVTADNYHAKLSEIRLLLELDPEPESEEGKRIAVLAEEIEAYETITWPITPPTAEEAAEFRRDQERNTEVKDG